MVPRAQVYGDGKPTRSAFAAEGHAEATIQVGIAPDRHFRRKQRLDTTGNLL